MDFKHLYTSTDGRISRKTWWIGAIILVVANIVVAMIILPLIGLGGPNPAAIAAAASDPTHVAALISGALQSASWGSLVVFLIFAYPGYCLSVKRRHDRDNKGLDVLVYFALTAVFLLIPALGLAYSIVDVAGVPAPVPTLIYSVLSVGMGIFAIYLLVVLGFLKGTPGNNAYGSDPVVGGVAATA